MTEEAAGSGILARDVTVTYRNGLTALGHASFEIPRGTVTALVGVNGAGKSTLFKALMDLLPHAAGQVRILGGSVEQALAKNLVAYVPQAEEVDWTFPVLVQDVVMMGRYGHMGFFRRPRPADCSAAATTRHGRGSRSDQVFVESTASSASTCRHGPAGVSKSSRRRAFDRPGGMVSRLG